MTPQDQQKFEEIRELYSDRTSELDPKLKPYFEHIYSLLSLIDSLKAEKEKLEEIMHLAQAMLTGLNVGDIQKDSKLHLKLREVMIQYREKTQ